MGIRRKKLPRLVDVMVKPPYPGRHISISSILDKEVVVTAFHYIPSQFKDRLDYLAIQVRRDSEEQWFTTSSSYILDFFERVAQEILPCRVTFAMEKDEDGCWTYTVK